MERDLEKVAINYWRTVSKTITKKAELLDIKHFLMVVFYYKFAKNHFEIQNIFNLKTHSTSVNGIRRVFDLWAIKDGQFLNHTEKVRELFPISLDKEILEDFRGLNKRFVVFLSEAQILKLQKIEYEHDLVGTSAAISHVINAYEL